MPASIVRRGLEAARDLVLDALDTAFGRRESLVPPRRLRFVGDGDFTAIGREFAGYLRTHAGLAPDHRVLDVGCGVGRIAVPLLDYLSGRGGYDGFDIVPRAIRWCERSIAPRNPRFRFVLADLRNEESEQLLRERRSAIMLAHDYRGCFVMDPTVPEAAIAYPQADVAAAYERAGFAPVTVYPGAWCGCSQFTSGQDMIVASKRPAPHPSPLPASGERARGA